MLNHDIKPKILKAEIPLKLMICVIKPKFRARDYCSYGYTHCMPPRIPSSLSGSPQILWKLDGHHWSLCLSTHEIICLLLDSMDFFR